MTAEETPPETPAFPAEVFDDRPCELGEGPFWHPLREQFFWFDILNKRMMSRRGKLQMEWPFDEMPSAGGWIDFDSLLVATESGLYRFVLETQKRELICPLEADNPDTRSNDGRVDKNGGFWVGTMSKKGAEEPGAGAIYRYYRGEMRRLYTDITTPNAICFAPGGELACFADTARQCIMSVRLDKDGWPSDYPEIFVDLRHENLSPDGAVFDASGALWNAQWGAGRVARYRKSGKFRDAFAVPGLHASCPAFGGPDLKTLIVTTAREHMESPDESQGRTYVLHPNIMGQEDSQFWL